MSLTEPAAPPAPLADGELPDATPPEPALPSDQTSDQPRPPPPDDRRDRTGGRKDRRRPARAGLHRRHPRPHARHLRVGTGRDLPGHRAESAGGAPGGPPGPPAGRDRRLRGVRDRLHRGVRGSRAAIRDAGRSAHDGTAEGDLRCPAGHDGQASRQQIPHRGQGQGAPGLGAHRRVRRSRNRARRRRRSLDRLLPDALPALEFPGSAGSSSVRYRHNAGRGSSPLRTT